MLKNCLIGHVRRKMPTDILSQLGSTWRERPGSDEGWFGGVRGEMKKAYPINLGTGTLWVVQNETVQKIWHDCDDPIAGEDAISAFEGSCLSVLTGRKDTKT